MDHQEIDTGCCACQSSLEILQSKFCYVCQNTTGNLILLNQSGLPGLLLELPYLSLIIHPLIMLVGGAWTDILASFWFWMRGKQRTGQYVCQEELRCRRPSIVKSLINRSINLCHCKYERVLRSPWRPVYLGSFIGLRYPGILKIFIPLQLLQPFNIISFLIFVIDCHIILSLTCSA